MRLACLYFLTPLFLLGCHHLVKIDVDCPTLCLSSPGPTLPGFANDVPPGQIAALDGAVPTLGEVVLDAGISEVVLPPLALAWFVEMDFNEVLRELPATAIGLSANVQVSSVRLTSTEDLSFIDSVDVFLGHDGLEHDGGGAATEPDGAPLDAGSSSPLACQAPGSSMQIAYFHRPENFPSSPSIDMVLLNPGLNFFDCMKDAPSRFDVKMTIRPTAYPAADVPLNLGTCIGVQTHASYP